MEGDGRLMPTTEAAKKLGVSMPTMRNLIKAGRLTAFSTREDGRANWITRVSYDRFIDLLEH